MIEITNFDQVFFVKKQLLVNIILNLMVFSVVFDIEYNEFKLILFFISVIVFILTFYFWFLFKCGGLIGFSRHKIFSYFLMIYTFFMLSIVMVFYEGWLYLLIYSFIFVMNFILYFSISLKALHRDLEEKLVKDFYSEQSISLFDFYYKNFNYKSDRVYTDNINYLVVMSVNFGCIFGLYFVKSIMGEFEFFILGGMFLFVSCFFLWKVFVKIMPIYKVLFKLN